MKNFRGSSTASKLSKFVAVLLVIGSTTNAQAGTGWIEVEQKKGCAFWENLGPNVSVVWTGTCKSGRAHGEGTVQWLKNGKWFRRWEGEVKNGKYHGLGTMVWRDGDRYTGKYEEGLRNGFGIYVWPSGERYEGEYKNGKKHGRGAKIWLDGRSYRGEFENGKYNGRGTFTWGTASPRFTGHKWQGKFADGKIHGKGTYILPTGEKLALEAVKNVWANCPARGGCPPWDK